MRTGSEYREALRDGRRIWVIGEGLIEDVTLHPATRPMVEEYVVWYDRHQDPEWRDLPPPTPHARRAPTPSALVAPPPPPPPPPRGRPSRPPAVPPPRATTHHPGARNP